MSPLPTPLPFGLRDVKVKPLGGDPGDRVDFPNSRTFSFSESEDFEELRGDDGVQAIHGNGPTVDWELEGGGVPLDAIEVMFGGTVTETGTSPNIAVTFDKARNDDRPYFEVIGQAISDSGGDYHVTLYKCRATGELSGELSDGSFWLTGASGQAIPDEDSSDLVYTFEQHETETAIATS